MDISGAAVIWLVFEVFVLWIAIKSSLEAWYVIRNRVTDKKGRPLWFYLKLDGLPVGAKDRKQALILTIGMAVIGFALPPLVKIVVARLA